MIKSISIKNKGLSLALLLLALAFIGSIIVFLAVELNIIRMNVRDAVRAGDVIAIKRALTIYSKSSFTGYPFSSGECLRAVSGPGRELIDSKAILSMPTDPLWPTISPGIVSGGFALSSSEKFCYFYYSDDSNNFKLSFFLESSSKAGYVGINTIMQ